MSRGNSTCKWNKIKKKHKDVLKENILALKSQQRFKNEPHNVFTEEIDKISLSSNFDKEMRSVESIEIYAYGTRKETLYIKMKKLNITM